jgi:hypothetical protein
VIAALATLLFSLSIASVFAAGYSVSVPIIGATGPAAIGSPPPNGSPPLVTGTVTLQYADGAPVVITVGSLPLWLCSGSSCTNLNAYLSQVSPGTYDYSFPMPSVTGAVTIMIRAYSLADDNGIQFPSVDTQIGSYVSAPASTSTSGKTASQTLPPTSNPDSAPNVPPQQSSSLFSEAVSTTPEPSHESPVFQILVVLTLLGLAAGGFLIFPSRK